jgi:mitogen-activated protein kinase kinase 9
LHISLDLPSYGFREYPDTSVASTSAPPGGEFRLSEFERLAVLGRGNGGTVYKVAHRRTSALCALKVLHRGNPGAAAEADALRRADFSPHVVRCHGVMPPVTWRSCSSSWTVAPSTALRASAGRSRRRQSQRSRRRRCPG